MAGRPPKPTALKVIQGTFQKSRAINEPIVRNIESPPKPPRWFKDHPTAKKEWRRITPLLIEQGTLAEVDLVALECYCIAYERAIYVEGMITRRQARLEKEGNADKSSLTFISPNGYEQQIPEVSIAQQARKECREFLTQFGMTPSSRSRINIQKKAKESQDPMEALLARP